MASNPDGSASIEPPSLTSLPPELLHHILGEFDVPDLAQLYELRLVNRALRAAATRALVSKLSELLVIEKDVTEVFLNAVRAIRRAGEGRLGSFSLGCLLRAAQLPADSFVTISILNDLWEIEDSGDARCLGLVLKGLGASPVDAVGALGAVYKSSEDGISLRHVYRALIAFDGPKEQVIRRVMASVLIDDSEIFPLVAALEGFVDVQIPAEDNWDDDEDSMPRRLVDPERAIPVLFGRVASEARRRYPGNTDGMINIIADTAFIWGNHELVGRAVGASSLLSWQAKVALVRRCAPRFGRGAGAARMVHFILGLAKSVSRNPPSDEMTRQLFAAVPVGVREATILALLDENTYPTEHTWQPCLALQAGDFLLATMLRHLFAVESDGSLPKLKDPRTDDITRFVSNLAVETDDVTNALSYIVRRMAASRPNSGIWRIAKSLVDAASAGPVPLIRTLFLESGAPPLGTISLSELHNTLQALDYLVPRLKVEELASLAVDALNSIAFDPARFSTGLVMRWHLDAVYKEPRTEYSPAGGFSACSEFLGRFMGQAEQDLEHSAPATETACENGLYWKRLMEPVEQDLEHSAPATETACENGLYGNLGTLLRLFPGDRVKVLTVMQEETTANRFVLLEQATDFVKGMGGKPEHVWNLEVAMRPAENAEFDARVYFASDEVRKVLALNYPRVEDVDVWGRDLYHDDSDLDAEQDYVGQIIGGLAAADEGSEGSTDEESNATIEEFSDNDGFMDGDEEMGPTDDEDVMWEEDPWADEEGDDDGGEDW